MIDYIRNEGGSAELIRNKETAMNGRVTLRAYTDLAVLMPAVEQLARERAVTSIIVESRATSLEIPPLTALGYTYVCSKPNNRILMAKIL